MHRAMLVGIWCRVNRESRPAIACCSCAVAGMGNCQLILIKCLLCFGNELNQAQSSAPNYVADEVDNRTWHVPRAEEQNISR